MQAAAPAVATLPPIGHVVDVAGRKLFLHHAGTGRPVTVFLAGAGMFGLGYLNVQQQAAELTTSVVYDRGGTGWSDDLALPRSARDVVEELRSLLWAAGLPGPYLLVAHSLGGLYARRYAQLHPGEVAGLLMLDPAHEDFEKHQPEVARQAAAAWKDKPMPEITPEMAAAYRPVMEAMYAAWPAEIRAALVERHVSPARIRAGLLEASNVDALNDELRNGGPVPSVPMIVYTAMGIDAMALAFSSEEVARANNQAKRATNEALAKSMPGAEHRVLEDASHLMLHAQRADAVIQGLRDLLDRIRRP
jgi:pimeloyl-ACP methyl ester carboxylesterase